MIKDFFEKYKKNKYIGYGITVAFFAIHFFWSDNDYYITALLTLYLIGLVNGLYQKIQYVEGAKPNLIRFSTANDQLYDLPSFLAPLFYLGIFAIILYMDNTFLGPFGVYYLIGYAMVSIWSSFYGKLPSARFSLDKETNTLEYTDNGGHNGEVSISEIKEIVISSESIILDVTDKKINLIHLSLDEKEMRLVSNYCRSQLHITPTLRTKEEAIRLQ